MNQSARAPQHPARPGGEFFTQPATPTQRRYEALRAYLAEGLPAAEVAARYGYTTQALHSAVRDFRAGRRDFFVTARPGPKVAPAKQAAHARVLELRAAGHSIDEIAAALTAEGTSLNRTGVAEIITGEGLPRLWRRPEQLRGGPHRQTLPKAGPLDFATLPERSETRLAGLLLAVPELVGLDLPAIVAAAGYPATSVIPATGYLLSLLALKLVGSRIAHVGRPGRRPGRRAVRRADRAPQADRAGHLLLPAVA